ncbi:hypothetical protein IB256_30250 [Pseudomonas sp. PDM17]|uniref:hypothetical protein n=1 Tax=Pseudomonas sp. PDM17 TaxID=2769285 RepID=UPI00177C241F|nr:hypothetical protein [Pseudomonas sp. PDM17]MBD9505102.1 hypothetical protein [Pseudomonas sp. PDM17]
MKLKILSVALLISAGLAGCDLPSLSPQAKSATPAGWVSLPALPVIEDAVMSLSPTFQGKRTQQFMSQICGMARGQLNQVQVNAALASMGIDSARLPRQSQDATALLVNGDRAAQASACAAYQATDVLMAANPKDFLKAAPATAEKAADNAPVAQQLDNDGLTRVLPIKIAQARANADVFALIAQDLQRKPGLSVAEYSERARVLFGRLAPTYLARVPAKLPPVNTSYQLIGLGDNRLEFSTNIGLHYDFSAGRGLTLTQNGVLWYGKGQLLGQDYRLKAAYFQPEVAELMGASKQ